MAGSYGAFMTIPLAAAITTPAVAWPTFDASLVSRELVADQTMSFHFAKPPGWTFGAGQFVDVTLLNPPETDAEGNTRGFSISSAPSEGDITITTRLRDTAFKRVLRTMPLGTDVRIEGPFGDLRLHEGTRPAVILTGGIGITPFRSILTETIQAGVLPYPVVLFYANRRPRDAAFLGELRALADADSNLTLVATMSDLEPAAPWSGERGRIDAAMLQRHLGGLADPVFYLTGPPAMTRALRTLLTESGVQRSDITTEEFTGY
jgi:ferredoxin-NADP reductase